MDTKSLLTLVKTKYQCTVTQFVTALLAYAIFKETVDSGFSADLDRYYQAVENLRSNPNSLIYKSVLENQGATLVESLQNIYPGFS